MSATQVLHIIITSKCVCESEGKRQKQEDAQRGMNVFILWFPPKNLIRNLWNNHKTLLRKIKSKFVKGPG